MPRKIAGIKRRNKGWRVQVRVDRLRSKQFPIDASVATMRAWQDEMRTKFGKRRRGGSGFQADVDTFLAKPEIAAQPYVKQTRRMLALWVAALGADRSRYDITKDEIEAVIQRWLKRYAEPTVYHRRSALLSLYTMLDGPGAANPVKDTTCPKSWVPQDHSAPYATLAAIVEAMPPWRYQKKGIKTPAVAPIVSGVIIEVGIRPADLLRVRRTDLHWENATLRWPAGRKGKGVATRTVPLTPKGLAAFRKFDAANLYKAFNVAAVSHAFKRTARRLLGDDTPIHLYSLRHAVGADVYRVTKDLATVGRMLNHAPGSRATAQYAQGANADVDRAAAIALNAARTSPEQENGDKLPAQLPEKTKPNKRNQLQRGA